MAAVTGSKVVRKNIKRASVTMKDALGAALMKEGYSIWRVGAKRTPVEAGILRRSWYVAPPTGINNPTVELGVGTDYAVYVHENLMVFHRVGGPKFIDSVVNERRSGYVKRIAKSAKSFFKRGIGVAAIPRLAPDKPSEESERA